MKQKETQSGGLIRDNISYILKSSVGEHYDKLLLYADGLTTMKKKGIRAMFRALNANFHTSTISRTLKEEQNNLNNFKLEHILRDGIIDKRERHYFIIDDTAIRKYGRNVYGSHYNYSSTVGSTIWSNCLVTFQLRGKKGR